MAKGILVTMDLHWDFVLPGVAEMKEVAQVTKNPKNLSNKSQTIIYPSHYGLKEINLGN